MSFNSQQPIITNRKQSSRRKLNNLICLEQSIQLPSNLLQQKKNILQQFRMLRTSQNSRNSTPRQQLNLMSKTFSHTKDNRKIDQQKVQVLIEERIINSKQNCKQKVIKNPLYKRLSNIQAESKELVGVSFSKLLSRMLIIESEQKNEDKKPNQYRRKSRTIDTKLRSIPNYQCLQSKLFTIQCPQNRYDTQRESTRKSLNISPQKTGEPVSNKIFRRYYNPHGQNTDLVNSYETVQYDQRYIYRNGKKTECKRIHNFYTSNMFKKSYEKHMRHTIDGFNLSTKPSKF